MKFAATVILVALSAGLRCAAAVAQTPPGLPEQPAQIAYASPQAALAALSAKPGVTMRRQSGWVIADDGPNKTIWWFPPVTSLASPAVVRRTFYVEGTSVKMRMDVMCGGTKAACDALVMGYQQLDAEMRRQASHLPGYLGKPQL